MTMFRLHPKTDKSQPKVLRVTVEIFLSLSRTLFFTNVSNVLETVHSFFLEGQKGENLHFMKLENVTGIGLSDLALLGLNTLKSVWIECQKTFGKEGIDFFLWRKIFYSICDYLILYDVRFSVDIKNGDHYTKNWSMKTNVTLYTVKNIYTKVQWRRDLNDKHDSKH